MPDYPDIEPKPGAQDPIPNEEQERTEVIGDLMWIAFSRGAASCIVTEEAVLRGRQLSRGYVRNNVRLAKTGGKPFPLAFTQKCAERCGRTACANSEDGMITAEILEDAWNHTKQVMMRAMAGGVFRGGGCS